jgi:hypothetical protein
MKVADSKKLIRQMRQLPAAQRRHIAAMQIKSAQEGVRVAKILVPRADGDLAETINYYVKDDGLTVIIKAGELTKDGQIKANTVEGGRDAGTRGGAMAAQPFIGPTRSYLAKKHKARLSRAINKAAKEVVGGG